MKHTNFGYMALTSCTGRMDMKITRCKMKKETQHKLLRFFALQVTARSAAEIVGIQYNSAALFYRKIREVIAHYLALEAKKFFVGRVEFNEHYWNGANRGGQSAGETRMEALFGILECEGRVFTIVKNNVQTGWPKPDMVNIITPDSIIYTDNSYGCQALGTGNFYYKQINNCGMAGKANGNGVADFWDESQKILRKYNGIDRKSFPLFLKECEFRFNYGTPKEQFQTLKLWCNI